VCAAGPGVAVTGLWRNRAWLARLVAGCVLVLVLAEVLSSDAGGLFGGIVTVVSVVLLVKRRYGAFAVFLLAAALAAWLASFVSEILLALSGIGHAG
jgi:hypothetical protein